MSTWLVEMRNNVDRRDDEAWKVRASSAARAKAIAQANGGRRFHVGAAVPWRGGGPRTKALAADLRTICTRDL